MNPDNRTQAKTMAERTRLLADFCMPTLKLSAEQILSDLRQTAITFDAVGDTVHAKPLIDIIARAHGKGFAEMYVEILGRDPE